MTQSSIYYYKPNKFVEYIRTITDKSIGISEALGTFRELKMLPKEFKTMTVQHLADKSNKILDLFTQLRTRMEPESPKLPYSKKQREQELINELAQDFDVDARLARAKVVVYQWPSSEKQDRFNSQIFNPILEVAIAPRKMLYGVKQIEIIASVNSAPGIDGVETFFEAGIYEWTNKEGYLREARNIRGILSECGFNSEGNAGWRKVPCVVFINLITPCPDWMGSAGKTHINLAPYQDVIAKVVSELAYKMPSIRTNPGGSQRSSDSWSTAAERGEYTSYLKDFLISRRRDVEADSSLRTRDRLTQSGVWYRIRPLLIKDGFMPKKGEGGWGAARKGLTGAISKTINELWPGENMTREHLGIIAKARAVLYFNGQEYPVTFDSISDLASLGTTDMIVIEKEGITDVLLEYARRYSIALVASGGMLVDYAKDLAQSAHINGINVSTLYDDDLRGREAPDALKERGLSIPRLGIDKSIVKWLQENGYPHLIEEELLEEYTPENRKIWKYDSYLQTHRIELDSIVAAVGAEALWKYIIHRLEEVFPEPRDYTNVIDEPKPQDYYPDEITEIMDYINEVVKVAYSDKWSTIQDGELAQVKGLLQTEEKQKEIREILLNIVAEDKEIKKIVSKFKEKLSQV
jgi:hypothetical protein